MKIRITTLAALFLLSVLSLCWAQEVHTASWTLAPEQSTYTVQHSIDVSDVQGHSLRIAEVKRDYTISDTPPVFNGVKATGATVAFFTDYVGGNGSLTAYTVYELENGERIFGRGQGTTFSVFAPDGSLGRLDFNGTIELTGGTGSFAGVRGVIRNSIIAEPSKDFNEGTVEASYWFIDESMASQ